MKTRVTHLVVVVAAACGIMGAAWAAKKELTAIAAEEVKWTESPDGTQSAAVKGDSSKGAHTMFRKFPAGQKQALHTHTNETAAVVVSGIFMLGPEGGPEKQLGPGSHFVVPGGVRHTGGCSEAGPCLLFVQSPGKMDTKMVGEPAPAKK